MNAVCKIKFIHMATFKSLSTFLKIIWLSLIFMISFLGTTFGQDQTVTLTTTGQGESLQQATDHALRSAIEQTFGTFISTRTEILDDELVSDQITSFTSGNMQSYEVLAQTQLSETLWGVTVSAVVSVAKLTSFVHARGVQVEIQGGLFADNIRQLNEEAEIEAVRNMVGVLHELFQTAFDFEIQVGGPVATDATSSNWKIPLTITASANENMVRAAAYFKSTMQALSLTEEQKREYKKLNKYVYAVEIDQDRRSSKTNIALRRAESFEMLEKLIHNLLENYPRLYSVDSGLDRKIGLGTMNRENHRFYQTNERNKTLQITLIAAGRQVAIFRYDDQRTLDEKNKLTGYTVQPLGVTSRAMGGGDVYNPVTRKTWMDRNTGALWPAISMTDPGAYGDHYTFEQAQTACPAGYRLPTYAEWDAERQSYSSNNAAGAFTSPLKLPVAGSRHFSSGTLSLVGSRGNYWSGTVSGIFAQFLLFQSNIAVMRSGTRARGFSVRCIKN